MTVTAIDYRTVVDSLKQVMKLYQYAINMKYDQKERLVLNFISIMAKQQQGLDEVVRACESTLQKWDGDSYPHDSDLIEETLKLLDHQYHRIFPLHEFDQDLIVYKVTYAAIDDLFKAVGKVQLPRSESTIMENLQRSVKNMLIDNPNFKGDSPYYRRHYSEYKHGKKLWIELLDNDFKNYIEYFQS